MTVDTALRPRRSRIFVRLAFAVGIVGFAAAFVTGYRLFVSHGGRLGLWRVVNEFCVPAERWLGTPFPCLEVRPDAGVALIRAPFGGNEFLVVPLAKVTGVEDPKSFRSDIPDLWSIAWAERGRIARSVGRPLADERLGLAVNSASARTQDQYHIHVDCLDPDIAKRLRLAAEGMGETSWRALKPVNRWGAVYEIRRIHLADLARERPETLIARERAPSPQEIPYLSIAVIGTGEGTPEDPGLLLAWTHGIIPDDGGHAEELMDQACRPG